MTHDEKSFVHSDQDYCVGGLLAEYLAGCSVYNGQSLDDTFALCLPGLNVAAATSWAKIPFVVPRVRTVLALLESDSRRPFRPVFN